MKKTLMALCAFSAICASGAASWKNLNDKALLAGDKVAEADLVGKAVLFYYWDVAEARSLDYLDSVEKTWRAFKAKKFVVIGSYFGAKDAAKVKEAVAKHKISFPVYYKAGTNPLPRVNKAPYFCVVNHRGAVTYSGASEKAATEAAVDAISSIGMPVALCENVTFKKFKGLANQIKLGKDLTSIVKKLERESKGRDPDKASEAQEIISAIDMAKSDVKSDIEMYKEADPTEAIKLIQLFAKTWPRDDSTKEYKASISDLKKAVRERAKAAKEKARAEKEKAKGK